MKVLPGRKLNTKPILLLFANYVIPVTHNNAKRVSLDSPNANQVYASSEAGERFCDFVTVNVLLIQLYRIIFIYSEMSAE